MGYRSCCLPVFWCGSDEEAFGCVRDDSVGDDLVDELLCGCHPY